jgi:sterol desaturase/sphingolipid hydroxylase (fatty acid hydroxylase superfamily)
MSTEPMQFPRPNDRFFDAYTDECIASAFGRELATRPRAIRVFRSRFVEEVFAKAHPVTPIIWFGPVIAYAGWRSMKSGAAVAGALLFVAGWLLWTLMEYLLHRFLFHLPANSERGQLRAFLIHGYHHAFPSDPMRLVAPPMMSWPLGALVATALCALLGLTHGLAMFAGTAAGYVAYDWIHYYTHHFRPRTRLGKWLRSYHMLHHHADDASRFGISSPLWDLILGTYRPALARASQGV